jgi:hypothetical protein
VYVSSVSQKVYSFRVCVVGFNVILGVQVVYLVIVYVVWVGSVNYVSIVNVIPLKDCINPFLFYVCQLSV